MLIKKPAASFDLLMEAGVGQYTAKPLVGKYIKVGVFILMILAAVIYLMRAWLQSWGNAYDEIYDEMREARAVSTEQKNRLFDPSLIDDDRTARDAVSADNTLSKKSVSGPLVPVDCMHQPTVCLSDNNCQLLCRHAAIKHYQCDQESHVCIDQSLPTIYSENGRGTDNNDEDEMPIGKCNTRLGEYALLQGYNEIGAAQWRCVALYPGWNDYSRYCEGGKG